MVFYKSKEFLSGAVLTLIGIILLILGIKFDTFVLKLFGGILTGGGAILMGISIFIKDITRPTKKSSRGNTQNPSLSHHPNTTRTTKKSRIHSSDQQKQMSQSELKQWLKNKTQRSISIDFVQKKRTRDDFLKSFKNKYGAYITNNPNWVVYGLKEDIPSLGWKKGNFRKYLIRGNYGITNNKKLKKLDQGLLSKIHQNAQQLLRYQDEWEPTGNEVTKKILNLKQYDDFVNSFSEQK